MTDLNPHILQGLFNQSLDLICILNEAGEIQSLSPSWVTITGWPEKEVLNRPLIDFIHQEETELTARVLDNAKHHIPTQNHESRYKCHNGQYIWLNWQFYTDPTTHGTIFGVAQDINEKKKEDQHIAHQIRLLEMAEQTAQVGHWHLNTHSGALEWSQEVFNIYGRKANKRKIELDDFIDAFLGDDRTLLWEMVQQASQDGRDVHAELDLLRSDGKIRKVVIHAFCEFNDIQTVSGIFGIIQDVTEQRRHQEALRKKDNLLSMAFRATSDGIWDWDIRTDKVWYSPQWKAQLGYGEDEIVDRFDSWADLIFEEDRLLAMEELEKHLKGLSERFEMVQRFRHKEGHTVFILSRAFAVRDNQGKALRLVGAHTDISELKRLEQAKSEFTSIVSHELRTPLTAIHGAIGLLNGHFGNDLSDQAKSLVQVANNNSDRLILLVNDILDMEKLQSGKMDFDLRDVHLEEFIPQAVENHLAYAKKFDVALDSDGTHPDFSVVADPDRLMQVMSNLLSNAIKFSPAGSTVKVRAKRQKETITISIIDQGRGIPKEMQAQIFDKFVQVDSSDKREKGGTGLGLAISKAMVENMNGTISVISKIGKGSTFTVALPKA